MNTTKLLEFFDARAGRGEALVLVTVFETEGSTYSKAGAQMLVDQHGVGAVVVEEELRLSRWPNVWKTRGVLCRDSRILSGRFVRNGPGSCRPTMGT